jgi:hypothetical protein
MHGPISTYSNHHRRVFKRGQGVAHLYNLLLEKVYKVSSYRQKCAQVWLLIVSNDLELPMVRLSTICKLGPEVEDSWVETTFDRVFFLNCAERWVVELSTGVGT